MRYPSLLNFSYNSYLRHSWKEILQSKSEDLGQSNCIDVKIPKDLKNTLLNLMNLKFIDDITLTPSLIQLNSERTTGKFYIEVHVNDDFLIKKNFAKRHAIRKEISIHQSQDLKFKIRFLTSHVLRFQLRTMATAFPLQNLYREKKCFSMKGINYVSEADPNFVKEAAINFFMIQFMRFRSSKQKTDLIGSKYVKSINLMYRFHLLSHYLEHGEVEFTSNINEIKHFISPQFSHIDPMENVGEEDWKLIRAQLIHFLKKIRGNLVQYDKNLSHLRF